MFKKFGQDLPQSLVDAVSGIMEAEKLPEPAKPDPEAIARRKRLQALKDKAEDERAEKGESKPKASGVKVHKGTYGTEYKGDMEEAYAKEELKGNQHKIDANKNGKIDAHDFKLLRSKKKVEEETEELDEASYSAKAAKAGKDIGKPGKEFSKIAKSAGEKYGSAEKGKKVAGAILKKLRAKHMKEDAESLEEKAVSQAQQKFMGMVYKAKKSGKAASPEVAKAAAGMTKKAAHDFAATKHKGLPQHTSEEVEYDELVLDLREDKKEDLPFTPDKPKGKIAVPGKSGYGPSAAKHLAHQGLKKFLKKETMMGKAGCTSEETEIEESRGHKIIATKLAQIDRMSTGIAPDHNTNDQSTKDKLKDTSNLKKSEIVTQKDTSMHDAAKDNEADELEMKHKLNKMSHGYGKVQHNEEIELDETATLDKYIKSMGYDPLNMDKNKKVMFSKTNAFKSWAQRQEALYDGGQKGTQDIDTHMSPGATARG